VKQASDVFHESVDRQVRANEQHLVDVGKKIEDLENGSQGSGSSSDGENKERKRGGKVAGMIQMMEQQKKHLELQNRLLGGMKQSDEVQHAFEQKLKEFADSGERNEETRGRALREALKEGFGVFNSKSSEDEEFGTVLAEVEAEESKMLRATKILGFQRATTVGQLSTTSPNNHHKKGGALEAIVRGIERDCRVGASVIRASDEGGILPKDAVETVQFAGGFAKVKMVGKKKKQALQNVDLFGGPDPKKKGKKKKIDRLLPAPASDEGSKPGASAAEVENGGAGKASVEARKKKKKEKKQVDESDPPSRPEKKKKKGSQDAAVPDAEGDVEPEFASEEIRKMYEQTLQALVAMGFERKVSKLLAKALADPNADDATSIETILEGMPQETVDQITSMLPDLGAPGKAKKN